MDHKEIVVAEIRPNPGRKILVISAYRSQIDLSKLFLDNLEHILQQESLEGITEFLVQGDLNYAEIKWLDNIEECLPAHCNDPMSIVNRYEFTQINHNPSRRNETNILD